MFVYRMEYDDNLYGIYWGDTSDDEYDLMKRKSCADILYNYDRNQKAEYGIQVHPAFAKHILIDYHFGFDSNTKFMRWFPEVIIKNIIKEKSEHLKFRIYDAPEDCVVSDETQCQFDRNESKLIISCNMGCINF